MPAASFLSAENRAVDRIEVHFHAQAIDCEGNRRSLLIVNISPMGLMARCNHHIEVGQSLLMVFNTVGTIESEVRWSLGGRIGCQFNQIISPAEYNQLMISMSGR